MPPASGVRCACLGSARIVRTRPKLECRGVALSGLRMTRSQLARSCGELCAASASDVIDASVVMLARECPWAFGPPMMIKRKKGTLRTVVSLAPERTLLVCPLFFRCPPDRVFQRSGKTQ